MNSKVSLFNWNYFKENMKKSRGVLLLFALVIPIFTYLFMLLLNNVQDGQRVFPHLSDLSIPVLVGMYIIPFILSVTLFNFVFKKDSVDFINALPLKRETIYMTNILGGIGLFFVIFLITSLLMLVMSMFFNALVIPNAMYFHYFLTFFVAYSFVFITSSLALSLTGSRMVHVALVLIIMFIPGFVSDFYTSRVHNDMRDNYEYTSSCSTYDSKCDIYSMSNDLVVGKSYIFENGKTLPYKYISFVPRAFFGMNTNEITYQAELSNVYDVSSIVRMIILSIFYIALGLYAFINRHMEIAESTFKNENVHQVVKCLTLFPLCLGAISIFNESKELIALWIMLAVIVTIYVVYDLITRRNSGKFMKSLIYFLGLVLVTILMYMSISGLGKLESSKVIEKDEVASLGIVPNNYFSSSNYDNDLSALDYKVTNKDIINLIFKNSNKDISIVNGKQFALRINLKDGASYYFNVTLSSEDFDSMLKLLDNDADYTKALITIPYDKVYGLQLGDTFLKGSKADKVISLIKDGYKDKKVSDIVNATYINAADDYNVRYSLTSRLYTYAEGIRVYTVSTTINPKLVSYVMQTKNMEYIENIKNQGINVNRLNFSIAYDETDPNQNKYYELVNTYADDVYRYINDNISSTDDFSKYNGSDLIYFNIYVTTGNYHSYQAFIPRTAVFDEMLSKVQVSTTPSVEGKY